MNVGGYILIAIALMGLIVVIAIDNYNLSQAGNRDFFETSDLFDTTRLHHEHIEVALGAVMFMILAFAYAGA